MHIAISQILNPIFESDDEDPYLTADNTYMKHRKDSHSVSDNSPTSIERKVSKNKQKSKNSKSKSSNDAIYENLPIRNDNFLSRSRLKHSDKNNNRENLQEEGIDSKNLPNRKFSIRKLRSRFSKKRGSNDNIYESPYILGEKSYNIHKPNLGSSKKRQGESIYENEHEENSNSLPRSGSQHSDKNKNREGLPAKDSNKKNHSNKNSLMQRIRSRFSRRHNQTDSIYENTGNHGERKSFYNRLNLKHSRSSKKTEGSVYETPYYLGETSNSIHRSSSSSSKGQSNDDELYLEDPAKSNSFRRKTNKQNSFKNHFGRRGSSIYGHLTNGRPIFYDKYEGFDIEPFFSKSSFSRNIYKKIWSDCDYKCFYKNGYEQYKIRVYRQINLLRKYHYARSLEQNPLLNRLAQSYADKMARRQEVFKFNTSVYGVTVGATFYPVASTIVTRWYDEYSEFHHFFNYLKPGSQMVTQLLWRDSKEIGIGAARGGNFLFLACFYYPKGNINGEFHKNILVRKPIVFN